MVEFGSGPVKETIDNTVFIVPGIVIAALVITYTICLRLCREIYEPVLPSLSMDAQNTTAPSSHGSPYTFIGFLYLIMTAIPGGVIVFFTYKLVSSLRQKERAKEEKKKMKQQRKEKEMSKKQKKK